MKISLSRRLKDYVKWLYFIILDRQAAYFHPRITSKRIRRYVRYWPPLFSTILKAGKISMLHDEVLSLLHFFVISSRGMVLEIGCYIGGSTVTMARAAKQYKKPPIIAIEPGGHKNHTEADSTFIPSKDIIADLKKNIESFGVSEFVCLLYGFSDQPEVYQAVKDVVGSKKIDLLMIDADGNVGRDMERYGSLLMDEAVLVFDDYFSPLAPEKVSVVREWVDKAVSEGKVIPLGVWGWGTWIGLYVKQPCQAFA